MRIQKIAQINANGEITGRISVSAASILLNIFAEDTEPSTALILYFSLDINTNPLPMRIDVPNAILDAQSDNPVSVSPQGTFFQNKDKQSFIGLFLFKDQLFQVDAEYLDESNTTEVVLQIKKQVYLQHNKLKRLKQEVDALEGIISQRAGNKRTVIPQAVKLIVYERDEGKCVECGSAQSLHFDHIIPVSKGGSNTEQNIQILCQHCNLKKSDKIAF